MRSIEAKLVKQARGIRKLEAELARKREHRDALIRTAVAEGRTQVEVAQLVGLTKMMIHHIVHGRRR